MSRNTDRRIARACMGAALLWAAALPLSVYAASHSPEPAGLRIAPALVYGVGAIVCHQRPERSFSSWGKIWPVCARCTGIYLGAALISLAGLAWRRQWRGAPPAARARLLLGLAALPSLLTLGVEWATGTMPGNVTRLVAGLPLGAAMVGVIAWTAVPEFTPRKA